MIFPPVTTALKLQQGIKRLFVGTYGFEDRSLGWTNYQSGQGAILCAALLLRYKHPKGKNRIAELKKSLANLGISQPQEVYYDLRFPYNIENIIDKKFKTLLAEVEEVVLDISAMTKLLILVCLYKLIDFTGTVRIAYTEAGNYSPTQEEYEKSKKDAGFIAKFPSRGFESIVRMKCLSSIRMQGQPVSLLAFTSFNEQLVRHMLGTMNPHRLIFINGRPPDYNIWRERATQEIHNKLVEEYCVDNPIDENGLLRCAASTLDYRETIERIDEIYNQHGNYERIICAATGSKMQTVGLFFSKIAHPDIHVEYPTPDSYYVKAMSNEVKKVHEVVIPTFSEFVKSIHE